MNTERTVINRINMKDIPEKDLEKAMQPHVERAMKDQVIPAFKRAFLCVLLVCMVLPAMGVTAVLFAWAWSMVK
jgi:hypothetical protein